MNRRFSLILFSILACNVVNGQDQLLSDLKHVTAADGDFQQSLDSWAKALTGNAMLRRQLVTIRDLDGVVFSGTAEIKKKPDSDAIIISLSSKEGKEFETTKPIPLGDDFGLIKGVYPDLGKLMGEGEFSQKEKMIALGTAWHNVRFEISRLKGKRQADGSVDVDLPRITEELLRTSISNMGLVEITSEPDQADIQVVGQSGWRKTSDSGFLPEGNVTILLSKTGFKSIRETRQVKRKGRNSFAFTLEKISK